MDWRGRIGLLDEVTLGEAAELLNLSPCLLRALVDAGDIPARTNNAVIRISRTDIEVYGRRFHLPPIGERPPPREAHVVVD